MDGLQKINEVLATIGNRNARAAFAADLCLMGAYKNTHFHYTSDDTAAAAAKLQQEGVIRSRRLGCYEIKDAVLAARLASAHVTGDSCELQESTSQAA